MEGSWITKILGNSFQTVANMLTFCWKLIFRPATATVSRRTMSNGIKITDISKEIKLREVMNMERQKGDRPLVLLYPFVYAKPAAVAKYCEFYHERGLDVVTIQGTATQFIIPGIAYKLSEELLDYLLKKRESEKYLVHTLSIGAYNYCVTNILAYENPAIFGEFRKRVIGQIFDSVTNGDNDYVTRGLASFLPPNKILHAIFKQFMNAVYFLGKDTTVKNGDKIREFFQVHPILVPTFIFYSKNDPMCDVPAMGKMIEKWQQIENFDVSYKCWEQSAHCAHLKQHPEEYISNWVQFTRQFNISDPLTPKL